MSSRSSLALWQVLLRLIALRVPRERRKEWLAEWLAELWYVAQEEEHGLVPRFCAGALDDARCLRSLGRSERVRMSGSALGCVAWLLAGAMVCFGLSQVLSQVRREVWDSMQGSVTDVVAIVPAGYAEAEAPLNRLSEERNWKRRRQHLFEEFGWYQPTVKAVHVGDHQVPEMAVARASGNLLRMTRAKVLFQPAASPEGDVPDLVLSESAWRRWFGGRRDIFGRHIRVGLQTARLAGVVADGTTPGTGRVDAWMPLPKGVEEEVAGTARVFAFGRVRETYEGGFGDRWRMTVDADTDHASDYECVALFAHGRETWRIFLFAALLALLALPATRALPLGDYPARDVPLPWNKGVSRWGFLLAKAATLLPGIYFGSMDAAFAVAWANPHTAQYVQLVTTFGATLFALRWCLRDQRQRCPVCLKKLTCPVKVGQPSRNFLSWHGTELMCSGGHGLLHVPELPTSWFGAPRWLQLDASWKGLFADAA